MRFTTRTFLWSFLPFAVLLAGSFWAVRTAALSAVREALRTSVRDNQVTLAREREQSESRNTRILRVAAENPALKAGLQLLATERSARDAARRTVEDQLSEICDTMGFDFLAVSGASGNPLAGVIREKEGFSPMDLKPLRLPAKGFFSTEGRIFQVTSVGIAQGQENVGTLAVGERFDLAGVAMPAVLLHGGTVLAMTTPSADKSEVEAALGKCPAEAECELRIGDETYVSVPLDNARAQGSDDGFTLRSLRSLDAAAAPVQAVLRRVFLSAGLTALLGAIALGAFSSRSIVRPLAVVVARLRESGKTGLLPEFPSGQKGVREIRELTDSFNHAAASIREGQDRLVRAYVEFVSSLASALDARDPYTAGHSLRVSEYSCAIARTMNVPAQEQELIRVGALLHDIGKIGISDAVLQKPGKLTPEEEALIQQHPVIGRKILECVQGFDAYLPVVELHHENWDGGGYPHGLKGEETPRTARIVKVADTYDAMTSDRPYRRGMRHEQAVSIIEKYAGTQFDPDAVRAFLALGDIAIRPATGGEPILDSLHHLAAAVRSGDVSPEPAAVEETRA
ncbi:MAG: HD domain-containing protein [Acidobacteriia bacterium]|nr:HD domain-containing protein [Terriglobia bacterium]